MVYSRQCSDPTLMRCRGVTAYSWHSLAAGEEVAAVAAYRRSSSTSRTRSSSVCQGTQTQMFHDLSEEDVEDLNEDDDDEKEDHRYEVTTTQKKIKFSIRGHNSESMSSAGSAAAIAAPATTNGSNIENRKTEIGPLPPQSGVIKT